MGIAGTFTATQSWENLGGGAVALEI
jgi:hypothetical protein